MLSMVAFVACSKGEPEDPDPGIDIPIEEGTTVCGRVYYGTAKTPVPGVVVTDGVLFTQTDSEGIYQLKSAKKNSLVYISVPAYYTVKTMTTASTQPKFYEQLTKDANTAEQHDFVLTKDSGQATHTRIVFGDIHIYELASCNQFYKCAAKINKELKSGVLKKPFGLTLGDMTWDWFWYANNYKIPNYLEQINKISGLQVFCTVGNHDHDMKYKGQWWNSKKELLETGEDWTCEIPYRKLQGPTCYSCNIGNVHYISMDDALTIDDGTGTKDGRGCELGFTKTDYEWLVKDMSYVPSDRTVVMSVHIPFTNKSGSLKTPSTTYGGKYTLAQMLAPFKGRTGKFLLLSAHTHQQYNTEDVDVSGFKLTEWNATGVCGNFWYSSEKGMNISSDGAPGGYRIIEFNGNDIKSAKYVPTEHESTDKTDWYPFRSYDVNKIKFSDKTTYPALDETKDWYSNFKNHATADGYWLGSSDNYVDIYMWDWKKGWTLTVKETLADGSTVTLTPEQRTTTYDALAMLSFIVNKSGSSDTDYNKTTFRVKASAPNTTLTITVKDEYGLTAKETMSRPKAFTWEAYQKEVQKGYNK